MNQAAVKVGLGSAVFGRRSAIWLFSAEISLSSLAGTHETTEKGMFDEQKTKAGTQASVFAK